MTLQQSHRKCKLVTYCRCSVGVHRAEPPLHVRGAWGVEEPPGEVGRHARLPSGGRRLPAHPGERGRTQEGHVGRHIVRLIGRRQRYAFFHFWTLATFTKAICIVKNMKFINVYKMYRKSYSWFYCCIRFCKWLPILIGVASRVLWVLQHPRYKFK